MSGKSGNTHFTMRSLIRSLFVAVALAAAGCVQLPPHPDEATAKQFQPVSDKAVIYVARSYPGPSYSAPIMLDEKMMGSLYSGTFFRWEVDPGTHRIAGFAADSASMRLEARAGEIYFIEQVPVGLRSMTFSILRQLDPNAGRLLVGHASLLAAR